MVMKRGTNGNDNIRGTFEADGLAGLAGDDFLFGGFGDDVLAGGIGDDRLVGGNGDDDLYGDVGADRMEGGHGDDTYWVDDAGDRVVEYIDQGLADAVRTTVSHTIRNGIEHLFLMGKADINGSGNDFDNVIVGNIADNRLDGGRGQDVLQGGLGDDIYVLRFGGQQDAVIEREEAGLDTIVTNTRILLPDNVENLRLMEKAFDNVLNGNSLNNNLYGNSKNNFFNGGEGADRMVGQAGDDTYSVGDQGDQVIEREGEGIDTVSSGVDFTLGRFVENLTLSSQARSGTGNELVNVIQGNFFDNVLDGRAGADVMRGGAGNDTYHVDNAGDVYEETSGAGTDLLVASISIDLSGSSASIEHITLSGVDAIDAAGNFLNNLIAGNGGANDLRGLGGDDRLEGGGGDDLLRGGSGTDALVGGDGDDRFYFAERATIDGIEDFNSADDGIFLDRSAFAGIGADGTLDPAAFNTGTKAQDADDRIIYDADTGDIYYDADGTGSFVAMVFATVTPGSVVTSDDFIGYS